MILKGGVSPAPVSLPPPRLSLRQRLGVSQPRPDEAAERAARRRVHQVTGASHYRQPPGGGQKRRHGAQPHRPRADRGRACRGVPQRRHARTTCTTDEQYRMRTPPAATQAQAAGPVPLPLVYPTTARRGLPAPDSAWNGGGGRSLTDAPDQGHSQRRFPSPLEHLRKQIHTPRLLRCPTNSFSESFLDSKMPVRICTLSRMVIMPRRPRSGLGRVARPTRPSIIHPQPLAPCLFHRMALLGRSIHATPTFVEFVH